ncbi:MAG: S41 family peptidase [Burkholderiaceae bacterium]
MSRQLRRWLGALSLALLAACGGSDDNALVVGACDVPSRQAGLRSYFDDWYFWYALSPKPAPGSQPTVDAYFNALLYTGTDANFPADRWSFHQSTESFNQFFGDGKTLGYGIAVAGLEVTSPTPQPGAPLYVRYVEPLSPAATAGVVRGDRVVSINGRTAAEMIGANDFSLLSPAAAGDRITVVLANASGQRTVAITAAVFALTPVSRSAVVTSPAGRKMGYLVVKDMITQAGTPMASAFQSFAAQGVTELVIDLRYNGGGFVSVARDLASYVRGATTARPTTFASLLYSDKRSGSNTAFTFNSPANMLTLSRVYVLAGPRTCSASEQVINALRPFVDVVLLGDTTCGKPVGFNPADDGCGETYSIVTFESVNARNEGRYFNGFDPRCAIAEDFTKTLGANDEPLLAAARNHADGIGCPVLAAPAREQTLAAKLRRWSAAAAEGERGVMIPK